MGLPVAASFLVPILAVVLALVYLGRNQLQRAVVVLVAGGLGVLIYIVAFTPLVSTSTQTVRPHSIPATVTGVDPETGKTYRGQTTHELKRRNDMQHAIEEYRCLEDKSQC
jgi:hypothetical protein